MPSQTTGRDVALARNNDNGKFDLVLADDGNLDRNDSREHAVIGQLVERRGSTGVAGWVLDETGTHGSLLYLITQDRPGTSDDARAYALDSLKVLVDEGEILPDVTADAVRVAPGRYDLLVNYRTPDGKPHEARIALRY